MYFYYYCFKIHYGMLMGEGPFICICPLGTHYCYLIWNSNCHRIIHPHHLLFMVTSLTICVI